jgi:hypothetical protein
LCAAASTFSAAQTDGRAHRAVSAPLPAPAPGATIDAIPLDVGDLAVSIAEDLTVWLATCITALVDEIAGHIDEDFRRARGHGDTVAPSLPPDPTLIAPATAAAPVPVSPSSEFTP